MMRALLALALALLWATPSLAQTDKAAGPPDPKAVAEADRLIAEAQAGDLFVNITEGEVPEVRHLRSGMRCTFEPGEAGNRIIIFPSYIARGDDVGCASRTLNLDITLYATRYPEPISVEEALKDAVDAIVKRFTDVKPRSSQYFVTVDKEPAWRAARKSAHFEAKLDGRALFTRVTVAINEGWVVKLRMTGPKADADSGDLYAELKLANLFGELDEPPPPPVK